MTEIINAFPGYEYVNGKNMYMGENVGFGGYVYSEPGMYGNVALLDIASQHPHSIIAMNCFGDYTERFKELVNARIAIKHEDWDSAAKMLDGKLVPYIQQVKQGKLKSKMVADALKIAINSVYGLTSASFDNPFRDIRNKNNIVALRGALFMVNLKHEIQKRGFTVAHIKTDSIKIPDATPEIISFVMEYGKLYGYNFEHEATYEKMCLVNDAVYIAKYNDGDHEFKLSTGEKIKTPWTATGTQFQIPYVFKKLFARAPINFKDTCETKAVSKGDLYLDMNESLPDVSMYEKDLEKAEKKYKDGKMSDTTIAEIRADLEPKIETGHNYIFVGRVGSFCPIKPGCGGGVLYRMQDGKYYAAAGTTGYRWLEAEQVSTLGKEDGIDISYYTKLVDDAVETISQYGDFEWFASDDPYIPEFMNIPETDEVELPWN